MAFSRIVKVGDGSTTQFTVNFALGYISESDVTCRVGSEVDGSGNPAYRTITFLSASLLQISGAAPATGVDVLFERTVPKDSLLVNFSDGDILTATNIDTAQKQLLMATQEALDGREGPLTSDIDAGGFTLTDLREPTAPEDAATKNYVDSTAGAAATVAAEAARDEAQQIRDQTAAIQTATEAVRDTTLGYKTDAETAATAAAASAAEADAHVVTVATIADLLSGTAGTVPDVSMLFALLLADTLIQNNVVTPATSIDVLLNGSAVVTKSLASNWAAGNGGGLDTGTLAASASYHVYMIRKDSDGSLDAVLSASATNPAVPTGWRVLRVVGALVTDGSSVIRPFLQTGDYFQLRTPVLAITNVAAANLVVTLVGIPHGSKVLADLFVEFTNSAGAGGYGAVFDADLGVTAPATNGNFGVLLHASGQTLVGTDFKCYTSAAGQVIANDDSSTTSTVRIVANGWHDPRVRRHGL